MTFNIRTNNVPRFIIDDHDLTREQRKDFDYLDWAKIDEGEASADFFRFKGHLYDLGEFTTCGHSFGMEGWDGYFGESAFSGVLVKFIGDDQVVVGMYFS